MAPCRRLGAAVLVGCVAAAFGTPAAWARVPEGKAPLRPGEVSLQVTGRPATVNGRPAKDPLWGMPARVGRRKPTRVLLGEAKAYLQYSDHVSLPGYNETVTQAQVATWSPEVQAVYRRLRPEGGEIERRELTEAYHADAAARLDAAAGGRKWVTRAAARRLAPDARGVWKEAKSRRQHSWLYDRAVEAAFPDRQGDQELFFDRSLPTLRKRAHHEAFSRFKVLERFPALVALVADGPHELADGTKLEKAVDPGREWQGVRISKGGSRFEVFADADQLQLGAGYGGMSYERVSIYVRLGETLVELERKAKQHPATATLLKEARTTAGNDARELR